MEGTALGLQLTWQKRHPGLAGQRLHWLHLFLEQGEALAKPTGTGLQPPAVFFGGEAEKEPLLTPCSAFLQAARLLTATEPSITDASMFLREHPHALLLPVPG